MRAPVVWGALGALLLVALSCDENLPSGPNTFAGRIQIVVPHDTVVVGDSSAAQAQAFDAQGRAIQNLTFDWKSADATILGFATPATGNDDALNGRTRSFVGLKPGQSVVTLSLPDPRFVASNATRIETVVVAGVRILSTRDSTLTSVN